MWSHCIRSINASALGKYASAPFPSWGVPADYCLPRGLEIYTAVGQHLRVARFPPTIIADATHDMLILTQETFGPVLGVCPVESASEALAHANNSPFGLAGFVFSRDLARGMTLCEGFEVGSVWLNDIQRSSHYVPFGGMKESGLGREKGRYGVESYLEYKTMYLSYEVPE